MNPIPALWNPRVAFALPSSRVFWGRIRAVRCLRRRLFLLPAPSVSFSLVLALIRLLQAPRGLLARLSARFSGRAFGSGLVEGGGMNYGVVVGDSAFGRSLLFGCVSVFFCCLPLAFCLYRPSLGIESR